MKGEVGQRWSLDPQPWSMTISVHLVLIMAAQVAPVVKNPPVNAGDAKDMGSIPGLGRSLGVGNGTPLQCSCIACRLFTDQQQGKPCFLGIFHLNGSLSSVNMYVHSLGMWVGPVAISNVAA